MALREFLEHVDQMYCSLHLDPVTVNHIYTATSQIVQHVVDGIGRIKPHLNAKEVLSIGSFAEETKICSPNEFDFMVCFDFLSRKENVWIESVEGCQPGYMVAFLNSALSSDGNMVPVIRMLYQDVCCIHHEGLRREFIEVLSEVIASLSMKTIVTPEGVLVIKNSEYLSIKLEWHKSRDEYKGPDIYNGLCERDLPLNTSYSLDVDVDLMPAVSVEDFSILSDIHGFPAHMIGTMENQKFHLVCKTSGQWPNAPYLHISHATTEVFLVRNLHPIHKQCYKLLKYLLIRNTYINRPMKEISLSSYVFKTAVLFHEYDKLCSGTPDTVNCCMEIIRYVRATLRKGTFPSFLMRNTNVWGQCYKFPIPNAWRPTNLAEEIYPFDWCFVLWFQLWRQFLGKALAIFQKIEMQMKTAEPESQQSSIAEPESQQSNIAEPESQQSNIAEPESQQSNIAEPESQQSNITEPESQQSNIAEPESQQSNIAEPEAEPESQQSNIEEPESQQSNIAEPESQQSNIAEPESQQSNIAEPETQQSDIAEPESQQSNFAEPESQQSNFAEPESQQSNFAEPESQQSNFAEPESQQSNIAEPESQQSNITEPESQQSNIAEPESQRSSIVEPESQQSNITEPESQQSNITEPESQQSNIAEPESQQSNIAEPESQQSNIAEPEAEPESQQSNIEEPESQQSNIAEPESQQSNIAEPESQQSNIAEPESQQSNIAEPESQQSNIEEPESQQCSIAEPESQSSNIAEPESQQSNITEPESQQSNIAEPESQQSNIAEPESQQSNITEPESQQSSIAEPESQQSNIAEPESQQSNIAEPESQQRNITEPESQQSNIAKPESRQSNIVEPESQQSNIAEPESQHRNIAEPESQQSNITEPESQQTKIAEPESQQSNIAEPESQSSSIAAGDLLSNSMSKSQGVLKLYVPNKYDPFLDEFAILREDALVIMTDYPRNIENMETHNMKGTPPTERVWELVLPHFPEYLSRIERVCERKMSIPKENFEEVL